MALNLFKNNFVIGVTSGIVAAIVAPLLVPALKRGSRPLAKGVIKGGMVLYEKGREAAAHAGEMIEDVMAEIQAEQTEKTMGAEGENRWEEEKFSPGYDDMGQMTPGFNGETSEQGKQQGAMSS
jgi:uncharacterized cupredoxin-like copper-binding protein